MDWVPRYTGVAPRDQCKLTCQARALGYYYVLEPRVRTRNPQAQSGLSYFPVIPLIPNLKREKVPPDHCWRSYRHVSLQIYSVCPPMGDQH